ncbi:MAG: putative metal homeostasis protein [Lactobacillaceae bacterium]|nr:putative metal homeostasis protein [Lactobacillaceae bacterium]
MAERMDVASARRKMQSPNIKTRKRALKALHDARRAAAVKK